MSRTVRIRFTHNLERNLDDIRRFLDETAEVGTTFSALIDELLDVVVPNLERFPAIGRDFLARLPLSAQGQAKAERLRERMGADVELREYIFGDYLLLYARREAEIYLLAVRHHRQLSFDLLERWL